MTDHYLTQEQEQRALALSLAHPLLVSKTLGGERSVDVFDLIRLAQWILDGTDLIDSLSHSPAVPSLMGNPVGDLTDEDWTPIDFTKEPAPGDGNTEDRV